MRRVSANKNVLSSRLNSVRQMSCCRSSAGRLFHSRGPATPKLLSPSLDCVRGTVHVWTSADRRCRRPMSVTSWQSSDRYAFPTHTVWITSKQAPQLGTLPAAAVRDFSSSSSSSCFCSHLKTELFCRAYGVDSP